MAFVVADRVKETTTTVGTGAVALAGAVTGFRTFASGIGNSNTTYYTIASQSANEWEVGYGTLDATSANLARTTVFASSNGGSLVTFSAGTKDVFVTQSAARTLVQASGGTTTNGVLYYTGSGVATGGSALTFDGTTLGVGANIALGSTVRYIYQTGAANLQLQVDTGQFVWAASNGSTEQMRLTGTGLGIGTSSPSSKLHVSGVSTLAASSGSIAANISGATPSIAGGQGILQILSTDAAAVDAGGVLTFTANTTSLANYPMASIAGKYQTAGAGVYGGYLQFITTSLGGAPTERMRLDSSGNLGIGTSSPGAKLDVNGSIYAGGAVALSLNSSGSNYGQIGYNTGTGDVYWLGYGSSKTTAGTAVLNWNASGNLGIGTSSPSTKLEVSVADASVAQRWVATTGRLRLRPYVDATSGAIFESTNTAESAYLPLSLYGSSVRMGNGAQVIIDSSGNLGIGTSSPGAKLDVAGNINSTLASSVGVITLRNSSTTTAELHIRPNSGKNGWLSFTEDAIADRWVVGIKTGNGSLFFNTGNVVSNTDRMILDSSGNLGIGASTAASNFSGSYTSLLVKGNSTNKIGTVIAQSFGTANATNIEMFAADGSNEAGLLIKGASTAMTFYTGSAPDKRMTLDASGNLGIGTSSPGATLDVNGATRIRSDFYVYGTGDRFNVFPQAAGSGASLVSTNNANSAYSQLLFDGSPLVFNVAGTERMRLNSSGNLGLGTSSPSSRLDVTGGNIVVDGFSSGYGIAFRQGFETTANLKIYASDPGGFGRNGALFLTAYDGICFGTGSNTFQERMRIDNAGNVGIGTTSPTNTLTVQGSVAFNVNSTTDVFKYYSGGAGLVYAGTTTATAIAFITSGSEKMRLDSSGNLGLGVTPSTWGSSGNIDLPAGSNISFGSAGGVIASNAYYNSGWKYKTSQYAVKYDQQQNAGAHYWYTAPSGTAGNAITFTQAMTLDASGNLIVGGTSALGTTSGRGNITVNGTSSILSFGISGSLSGYVLHDGTDLWINNALAGAQRFYTNGSERARIDSSGNLLVGTTTAYGKISLVANTNANNDIWIRNDSAGSSSACGVVLNASGNSWRMGMGSTANNSNALTWVLDTTSPSEKMRLSTAGGFSVGTAADPGAGAIYATGNITAYYSDDRLKNRLGSIENALDKIDQLSGFYYEANETAQQLGYTPKREVGVSAQDVQKVMPEIVSPAPIDPEYLTISYERLTPLLIEAIKELRAEVRALKK